MKVTLKDIAKAAGVYPTAVSAVLNNRNYTCVSEKRRAHIRKIAEEMGYRPNYQAVCLRRGKKPTVGVFLPDFPDLLLYELIKGLEATSRRVDIPLLFDFGMTEKAYSDFISSMTTYSHTGIISYVPYWEKSFVSISRKLEEYIRNDGKVISLNMQNETMPNTIYLQIDEAEGGRLAADYLQSRLCASFAVISFHSSLHQIRCAAFRQAMAPGKPLHEYLIPDSGQLPEILANFDRIFRECPRPVGIFCATGHDFLHYLISRALERGLQWRKDYHVVSYDVPARHGDYYPVARIVQPFYRLGELAMESLDTLLKGKEAESVILNPTLDTGE